MSNNNNNNNNNKVKGLLKGLRFISQIFDNEKDQEIEISNPTDVKHVAHIGWEGHGPSENPPSWMNEFHSVPGNPPATQNHNGDNQSKVHDNSVKQDSEDSMRRVSGSSSMNSQDQEKDISEVPKPSKQRHTHSTPSNIRECHGKEKSDRPRPKKHSKHSQPNDHSSNINGSNKSKKSMERPGSTDSDSLQLQESDNLPRPPKNPPDHNTTHKKSRHKMTKDGSNASGSSSKSRSSSKVQTNDTNSNSQGRRSRSSSKSGSQSGHFEEEEDHGQLQGGSREEKEKLRNYPN